MDSVAISVRSACTIANGSGIGNNYTATMDPGSDRVFGPTVISTVCNDLNGYAVYAVGYSGESYETPNNTKLLSSLGNTYDIATGTDTSSATVSSWAMKVEPGTTGSNVPSILNGFNVFRTIPGEYAKIAEYAQATSSTSDTGATIKSSYQVHIASTQAAGTYTGKVKYTMVHPSTAPAPVICNDGAETIAEVKCMQDFVSNSAAIMSSMTTGTTYSIKDKRDGKTYTIAKLADGNVWMTQNLDLDLDASMTYTNEDTDLGYNTTTQSYDTASWSPSMSTYSSSSTTWNYSTTTPESYDAGDLYWNGVTWPQDQSTCTANGGTWNDGWCDNPVLTSSTGVAQYHLGNYYNWTAALAMNDSSSYTSGGSPIEQSICPAGWTLPRAGTGEDSFHSLLNQYGFTSSSISGSNNMWSSPLYFVPAGYWDGSLEHVGSRGAFW